MKKIVIKANPERDKTKGYWEDFVVGKKSKGSPLEVTKPGELLDSEVAEITDGMDEVSISGNSTSVSSYSSSATIRASVLSSNSSSCPWDARLSPPNVSDKQKNEDLSSSHTR